MTREALRDPVGEALGRWWNYARLDDGSYAVRFDSSSPEISVRTLFDGGHIIGLPSRYDIARLAGALSSFVVYKNPFFKRFSDRTSLIRDCARLLTNDPDSPYPGHLYLPFNPRIRRIAPTYIHFADISAVTKTFYQVLPLGAVRGGDTDHQYQRGALAYRILNNLGLTAGYFSENYGLRRISEEIENLSIPDNIKGEGWRLLHTVEKIAGEQHDPDI